MSALSRQNKWLDNVDIVEFFDKLPDTDMPCGVLATFSPGSSHVNPRKKKLPREKESPRERNIYFVVLTRLVVVTRP